MFAHLGNTTHPRLFMVMIGTLLMAEVLAILSHHFFPVVLVVSWVAPVLIYWHITAPRHVGLFWGWLIGLVIDVQHGWVLGLQASGFLMMSAVTLSMTTRYRALPQRKLAIYIAITLLCFQGYVLLVAGFFGDHKVGFGYWLQPLVVGALCPFLYRTLDTIRMRFTSRF